MTPMFEQFLELKAQQPDAILFFRMGDFYETFFSDAEVAAEVLELTLTARNKGSDNPVPMAGVPHHAADGYIRRLVDKGYRVAIAEQMEDPAAAKGLVRRAIVRVVTPGVVLDASALQPRRANYLAAVSGAAPPFGVAFLDASTGDLRVTEVDDADDVCAEMFRLEPRELLLDPALPSAIEALLKAAVRRLGAVISPIVDDAWDPSEASREARSVLGVADLAGFGVQDRGPEATSAGAVLRYARQASGASLDHVVAIRPYRTAGFMVLDDTTVRNLEVHRTLLGGRRKGSLLWLMDKTATAMGSRLLKEWLAFPLLDVGAIGRRHSAVGTLVEEPTARDALRRALREVADVERIAGRVSQGNATPRDLDGLRRSLLAVPVALAPVEPLAALTSWLPEDRCADVAAEVDRWLVDDPPTTSVEGGVIRRGVHDELDAVTAVALDGVGMISRLQEREREATGISSLKIRNNKVFGYFIEVTRANLHKVPDRFLRKQTIANGERYITEELKELESQVSGAEERRKALEYSLFTELRERVGEAVPRLQALARALAGLDVLANLAEVAVARRFVRPELCDEPILDIEGGRHPVVEAMLDEERFVPNDVRLDTASRALIVLTGPNMAGKSTVMRQVALIALLAQIGSFVPAHRARIGVADRVFTRVGASDDLTRGASTFMVEMSETAAILHHATERSLVVLDEIGRGTSTYDGLAIAWAVAEDLVDRVGCRALFATHYHELCELADVRPTVVNQSIAIREWGDTILFLRQLQDGGASRSYGIQCARLAGLPAPVISRARALLTRFEKHAARDEQHQLSLFGGWSPADAEPESEPEPDLLRDALSALDPDALSPRDALEALYQLKRLVTDG